MRINSLTVNLDSNQGANIPVRITVNYTIQNNAEVGSRNVPLIWLLTLRIVAQGMKMVKLPNVPPYPQLVTREWTPGYPIGPNLVIPEGSQVGYTANHIFEHVIPRQQIAVPNMNDYYRFFIQLVPRDILVNPEFVFVLYDQNLG
ncbi:MAG: hypothetical protein JW973_11560 [Bacteroidales bacterium]|nr:hypothetical protein [Bacteroidales bacterium]